MRTAGQSAERPEGGPGALGGPGQRFRVPLVVIENVDFKLPVILHYVSPNS